MTEYGFHVSRDVALLECLVSSGFHGLRSSAYFELQLQRRRVYPTDLGYVPREVGFHGHLLEFRWCPFRGSMQSHLCSVLLLISRRPTFIRLSTWLHMNQKSINFRQQLTSRYSAL